MNRGAMLCAIVKKSLVSVKHINLSMLKIDSPQQGAGPHRHANLTKHNRLIFQRCKEHCVDSCIRVSVRNSIIGRFICAGGFSYHTKFRERCGRIDDDAVDTHFFLRISKRWLETAHCVKNRAGGFIQVLWERFLRRDPTSCQLALCWGLGYLLMIRVV